MRRITTKIAALWCSGTATRLLLLLFGLLVVSIVLIGLDDTPGYTLGYIATAVIFLVMVRRWRSIKNYVILMLATFCIAVFLSAIDVEVITRIAVWNWGPDALYSPPMRIIDAVINYLITFGGPVGLAYGFTGALVLAVIRLVRPKREQAADRA
jgi:hypothetical protein